MYLINHKYKYIVILNTKSGCSTMRYLHQKLHFDEFTKEFQEYIKKNEETAFHYINYGDLDVDEYKNKNYFIFSIVRNSYNRVCSMYFNRFLNIAYEFKFKEINTEKTFYNMLEQLPSLSKVDFHYIPQIINNKIDKYIYLENLYDELLIIYKKLNFKEKQMKIFMEFKNKNIKRESSGKKIDFNMDLSNYNFKDDSLKLNINNKIIPSYSNLLNKKTISMIYKIYKKEIDKFKFSQEDIDDIT